MVLAYGQRPSTARGAGMNIPAGYKVNVNGEIVPESAAQAAYDKAHGIFGGGSGFLGGGPQTMQGVPDYNAPEFQPQDSGGGGGGGGSSRPFYDPNTDPAFQALLSSLGLQETQARTAAGGRMADIQAQLGLTIPRIMEQGVESRRGINQGFENRGFYRSGERLRTVGVQQSGEAQRVAATNLTAAQQQAEIQRALDAQIGALATQRAQAQLDAGMRSASY